MTRLTDMDLLAGQVEEITLTDLRRCPGDVFAQVQMGKVFTVTKNGKAIAVVSQPEPNALELGAGLRRMERREDDRPPH